MPIWKNRILNLTVNLYTLVFYRWVCLARLNLQEVAKNEGQRSYTSPFIKKTNKKNPTKKHKPKQKPPEIQRILPEPRRICHKHVKMFITSYILFRLWHLNLLSCNRKVNKNKNIISGCTAFSRPQQPEIVTTIAMTGYKRTRK